jgi:cyclopropane fatty-acyl-phospholipid synthase-like methyltransferase
VEQIPVRHRKDQGRYYKGIPIHAAPGVHEAVEEMLGRHVQPPATILDLGGGSGALAARLLDRGYQAELADLDPPPAAYLPTYRVDLNSTFDVSVFGGKHYDAIVASEVIEHLENPRGFIQCAGALLNKAGILLLTTPNTVDLDSRRRMLTRGEFWLFRKGTLFSTGHLSILPFWLLQDIFRAEGWIIRERRFIGRKGRKGWRKFLIPAINLALFLVGSGIPMDAAFAPCVAFVCMRKD